MDVSLAEVSNSDQAQYMETTDPWSSGSSLASTPCYNHCFSFLQVHALLKGKELPRVTDFREHMQLTISLFQIYESFKYHGTLCLAYYFNF